MINVISRDSEELLDILWKMCEKNGWDFSIKADMGYRTNWGAEVRLTKNPNRNNKPDRSKVTFAAGGRTAEEAMGWALEDMIKWIK